MKFLRKILNKKEKETYDIPFWPHHILREMTVALVIIALILTLATFFPVRMGAKADPYTTPDELKPEWYFLASYQFLQLAKSLPFIGPSGQKWIGMVGTFLIPFLIIILPFLDRNPERRPRKRIFMMGLALVYVIFLIILSMIGTFS